MNKEDDTYLLELWRNPHESYAEPIWKKWTRSHRLRTRFPTYTFDKQQINVNKIKTNKNVSSMLYLQHCYILKKLSTIYVNNPKKISAPQEFWHCTQKWSVFRKMFRHKNDVLGQEKLYLCYQMQNLVVLKSVLFKFYWFRFESYECSQFSDVKSLREQKMSLVSIMYI